MDIMFKLLVTCGLVCLCLHEGQALTVTLSFNDSSVVEGSDVNMTCSWNGNVETVSWKRVTGAGISVIGGLSDESNNGFDSSKYISQPELLYSGLLSHSIILRNAQKADEGRYTCQVLSGQFLHSSDLLLKVIEILTTAAADKDQGNGETTLAAWEVTESDVTAVENMMSKADPQTIPRPVGLIAGATAGGVVFLAVVGAILVFFLWKRRKQDKEEDYIEEMVENDVYSGGSVNGVSNGNHNPTLSIDNETTSDHGAGPDSYIPKQRTSANIIASPGAYAEVGPPPDSSKPQQVLSEDVQYAQVDKSKKKEDKKKNKDVKNSGAKEFDKPTDEGVLYSQVDKFKKKGTKQNTHGIETGALMIKPGKSHVNAIEQPGQDDTQSTKPVVQNKPTSDGKPVAKIKPSKPIKPTKPPDTTKSADTTNHEDATKLCDTTKPNKTTKPAKTTNSTEVANSPSAGNPPKATNPPKAANPTEAASPPKAAQKPHQDRNKNTTSLPPPEVTIYAQVSPNKDSSMMSVGQGEEPTEYALVQMRDRPTNEESGDSDSD